jgi:SAM-dependent methyltransferase
MKRNINRARSQSWDAVAHWYAGWTGTNGSRYHRTLAVPLLLEMLDPQAGEHIADLGCGPGILAPPIAERGARFVGVDLSPRLIAEARKNHGRSGRFLVGDATHLPVHVELPMGGFDGACFLLSIQDINPLDAAIASAARLLKPGGRLAIVMLHPCFRVPRQSGWGWDEGRGLKFRRLDSYLTPLAVPMQSHGSGTTRSYHRPLGAYVNALSMAGMALTGIREIGDLPTQGESKADRRAAGEFPLFLGLKAVKLE